MILISPFRHRLPTAAARRAVCLTMSRTWILLPACSGCCRFMTMNCSRRMGAGPVHRAVWYRKLTNTCRHFISLARILDLSELPMEGFLPAGWLAMAGHLVYQSSEIRCICARCCCCSCLPPSSLHMRTARAPARRHYFAIRCMLDRIPVTTFLREVRGKRSSTAHRAR